MKADFHNEEQALVERLYQRYAKLMFKIAFEILKDPQYAEDAVQLAFERILHNLHKIEEENDTKTRNFVVIISRNVALNLYNQRLHLNNRCSEYENLADAAPSSEPQEIVLDRESVRHIRKIVEELPQIYRDVLLLRMMFRLHRNEIASLLGIKPETVKKRLFTARKMVAEALEREQAAD